MIRADRLGSELGLRNLYLKNDTVLPTGSLKDRSNSVGLSVARELGFTTAAVMSTGNAAASVAAYAAAAGIPSVVMVPAGTAASKIIQARAYGSTVVVIDGDFDNEVARVYKAAVQEFGWYDCLSSNPYRDEGKKSYAYEMADQNVVAICTYVAGVAGAASSRRPRCQEPTAAPSTGQGAHTRTCTLTKTRESGSRAASSRSAAWTTGSGVRACWLGGRG